MFFYCFIGMTTVHGKTPTIRDLNASLLLNVAKFLSLGELCTVKGVCKRFRMTAIEMFRQRYEESIHFDDLMFNMHHVLRVIRCFGPHMTSLTVDGSFALDLNETILTSLIKRCQNLKKLKLICFHFDKSTVAIMKALVPRLEVIEFLYCTIESKVHGVNYNVILKAADRMKELAIIGNGQEIDLKVLNKKWNGMQRLEIVSVRVTDEEVLGRCLEKNTSIKHFSYMPNEPSQHPCMQTISNFGNYLEEFVIELNKCIDYVPLFESLQSLRRIVINCQGYNEPIQPLVDILARRSKLEVFGLWNVDVCELTKLPKMDKIKTLELRKLKNLGNKEILAYALVNSWTNTENLYLDHTTIHDGTDLEIFVEGWGKLKNLFLCDIRSFFIMPSSTQYKSWCTSRKDNLNIFVDSRYLTQDETVKYDLKIAFKPFKNRISQFVNVISGANL